MSMHQYIGARYVPIYYQNSLDPDSTEWEPNVSYEALTIVTLPNLHSYISKKTVPDSVGSPALNAEYWLDQGYANAYIQNLQDQIDDMNDGAVPGSLQNQINTNTSNISDIAGDLGDISNLNTPVKDNVVNAINSMLTKSVICISDSYGTYPAVNNNWMSRVQSYLGLDSDHFYSRAYSGSGFGTGGETFQQQLETLASSMSTQTKNAITDIVIGGGFNDAQNSNQAAVTTAAENCLAYIRSTFPNAKAHIAFFGWSFNSEWISEIRKYGGKKTYQSLVSKGYDYIVGSDTCLRGKDHFTQEPQGDTPLYLGYFYGHPSATGAETMAICVCNHLKGYSGFRRFAPEYYLVSPTLASGITLASGSTAFYMEQQGDMINVIKDDINNTVLTFSSHKDIRNGITIEIGTMNDGLIGGIDSSKSGGRPLTQMLFTGEVWKTGTGWITVLGTIMFMNNKIYVRLVHPDVSSAESVTIFTASGSFPAYTC